MTIKAKPYFRTQLGEYYLGDSTRLVKEIPESIIDAVITDPPFFEHGKHGVGTYRAYQDILPDLRRVLKRDAWLVVYFPSNRLPVLFADTVRYFTYVDRFIVEYDLTNTKGAFGDKRTLELCVFKKGSPRIVERVSTDVLPGLEDPAFMTLHPKSSMWKPTLVTALILKKIVGVSGGKVLLDPFAGYGSIVYVAERLGMRWIGIDIDKRAADVARKIFVEGISPRDAIHSSRKGDQYECVGLDKWLES